MSESHEDLIAERDGLIDQLQGQWDIQKDKGATNRLALRLAGLIFFAGFLFSLIIAALSFVFIEPQPTESGNAFHAGEFILFLSFLSATFSFITYISIQIHALWWRQLNPLHVNGVQLVWKKRKGHVPERLNLHALTEVTGYEGEGVGGGKLFIWVVNLFGESTFSLVNPCIFVSKGDLSPPKISGAMFQDGDKLIGLLAEIGEVNTKLAEFKSDESD